jgi:hypothetical protein
MAWLVEDPWPVVVGTLAVLGVLAVVLYRTGRGIFIAAMIAVALLGCGLLLVERLVVTERERVEAALEGAAAALERNDLEGVLSHIAPEAGAMRASVAAVLPGVEVTDANIGGDLKVTFNNLTNPPSARADFTGRVTLKSRSPSLAFPFDNFVRPFTVRLRREGDRWVMTEYQMGDLTNPLTPEP